MVEAGKQQQREVDKAWDMMQKVVPILGVSTVAMDNTLIHALERQAYAIAGSIFHARRPDIVNESLTRAWKSMGKFRGDSKFSTWFHRIVVNVCKQHGAKETARGKREVSLEDMDLITLRDGSLSPLFHEAITVLTKTERFFLYDKLCSPPLSDAEVATKWGLSASGVRGRWMRIKRKIKAAL